MVYEIGDFIKWVLRTIKKYPCVIAWLSSVDAEEMGGIDTLKSKLLVSIHNGLDLLNNLYEYENLRGKEGLDEMEWNSFYELAERLEWLLEDCPFGKLDEDTQKAKFRFNCSEGMIEIEQKQQEVYIKMSGRKEMSKNE